MYGYNDISFYLTEGIIMKKSLETKLTDGWKNIFQRADYFEAVNYP